MFKFVKNDNGNNFPVVEVKKATAATYAVGDALIVDASTGYVAKTAGTVAPTFICAQQADTALSAGDELAVNPIYPGQTWGTTFSANGSSLKAGTKVTIDSTSKYVTATTTNGVATLVTDGAASGSAVLVKF